MNHLQMLVQYALDHDDDDPVSLCDGFCTKNKISNPETVSTVLSFMSEQRGVRRDLLRKAANLK